MGSAKRTLRRRRPTTARAGDQKQIGVLTLGTELVVRRTRRRPGSSGAQQLGSSARAVAAVDQRLLTTASASDQHFEHTHNGPSSSRYEARLLPRCARLRRVTQSGSSVRVGRGGWERVLATASDPDGYLGRCRMGAFGVVCRDGRLCPSSSRRRTRCGRTSGYRTMTTRTTTSRTSGYRTMTTRTTCGRSSRRRTSWCAQPRRRPWCSS
jgi:hypothetical protein